MNSPKTVSRRTRQRIRAKRILLDIFAELDAEHPNVSDDQLIVLAREQVEEEYASSQMLQVLIWLIENRETVAMILRLLFSDRGHGT